MCEVNRKKTALPEVTDAERAVHDLQRIRREIDGLISYYAARVPARPRRGPVVFVDPLTGEKTEIKRKVIR